MQNIAISTLRQNQLGIKDIKDILRRVQVQHSEYKCGTQRTSAVLRVQVLFIKISSHLVKE